MPDPVRSLMDTGIAGLSATVSATRPRHNKLQSPQRGQGARADGLGNRGMQGLAGERGALVMPLMALNGLFTGVLRRGRIRTSQRDTYEIA
jgi:hypothetical protein